MVGQGPGHFAVGFVMAPGVVVRIAWTIDWPGLLIIPG